MASKTILAVSAAIIAAILGASVIMTHDALATGFPSWLIVSSSFETSNPAHNAAVFSATTGGTIPQRADSFILSNAVTGFAWADITTGKAVVATIHPSFKDDTQNPSGWHVHTVTLTAGAGGSKFCVASIDSAPETGVATTGNHISVGLLQSQLPSGETTSTLTTATGFVVNHDSGCSSDLGVFLDP